MKPLRVVLVTRWFWPVVDGPSRNMANLGAELAAEHHAVTVVTARWGPRWPKETMHGDLRVVRLSPPPTTRWRTIRWMQATARWLAAHRDDVDLVYVSGLRQDAYAALRGAHGRLPVVLRAESAGPAGDCQWQRDATCGRRIREQCRQADALVAPTRTIEHELIATGYARPRIHGLPTGVPVPPPRGPEAKSAARETLAATNPSMKMLPGAPLAVYVGRLDSARGLVEAIAAWQTVAARHPEARLWLLGEGSCRRAIQDQIDGRCLAGKVLLAGTFDRVDEVLAAADLFVLPAATGGMPIALLEAMAAGLPIVTLDSPDHLDLVTHEREALLVRVTTSERLADAMLRLLDDPAMAQRLGAAARRRALTRFSSQRMAEEHLRLFVRLVEGWA
jgi:glycosyltransferase involved in cell wall biosynthesis